MMIRNHKQWWIWFALLVVVLVLSLSLTGSRFPVSHAATTEEEEQQPPQQRQHVTFTCSNNGGQGGGGGGGGGGDDTDGDGSCVDSKNTILAVNVNVNVNTNNNNNNNNNDDVVVVDPFQMWVDNVGEQTKQFLQDHVFGKAEALFSSNIGLFPSNEKEDEDENENENEKDDTTTTKEEKEEEDDHNPFKDLLDQLSSSLDKSSSFFKNQNSNANTKEKQQQQQQQKKEEDGALVSKLLEHARLLGKDDENNGGGSAPHQVAKMLGDAFLAVLDQLKETFGTSVLDGLDAALLTVSLLYYLGNEDQQKNPTWKRQQHRFYDTIPKQEIRVLHDALYLAQLAYVDTLEEFQTGLHAFQNDTWELVYGMTESLPHLPAHFLVIHKQLAPLATGPTATTSATTILDDAAAALQSILPWPTTATTSHKNKNRNDNEIQMGLIVRGTKHLADALADGLLKPAPYRGGYAHEGILTTGRALVDKHLAKLKELLVISNRKSITMYVVGHSLGAGAGAIAAMEFNDHDFITAKAIGFGCPSILSKDLSLSTKDYIRTVVSDADVVPRLSGASIVNVLLDLMEFDWGEPLLEDVALSLHRAKQILPAALSSILPPPELTLKWLNDFLDANVRPQLRNKTQHPQPRLKSVLIPPGTCVHFYRDGVGYTGAVTPCDFFSSIDISRTLIDDHLIVPGYHRALLTLMRDWEQNFNFDFPHDIASLPV